MGKGKALEATARQRAEWARKAGQMRREGAEHAQIALELGVSVLEAAELARAGLGDSLAQSADDLRIEVEARFDDLLRRAHLDLKLAESQAARTALYRTILAIEGRRAQLLGLDLPKSGQGDE